MTTTEERAESIPGYRARMTEEEFERWAMAERVRAEWVEGEVILMSPVSYDHTNILEWLMWLLKLYTTKHQLGEVHGPEYMNRLKGRRRLPDIFFVAKGRERLFTKTYLSGPADLIVEVVSPDSQSRDWRDKYLEYESNGVREYWIVDPLSEAAEFYELTDGKYVAIRPKKEVIRSVVLDGFWLQIDWLWQKPLPDLIETAKTIGML
jgi:Uma2 family endonuclease